MHLLLYLTACFLHTIIAQPTANTTLELVFVIFRHGERVPETNEQYPTDNYPISSFQPMTYGEITKKGKQRQFRLGQKLRERYDEFLGPLYKADQVAAYSTDWDRTKTSVLLTLAGLFPPDQSQVWNQDLKWTPIPFNYKTSDHDFLLQRPDPYCPRYVKELNKVLASDKFKLIKEQYKEWFTYVEEKTGRKMFDFHEMFRIYQNLHSKKFLNLNLPDWAEKVYPEPLQTIASYQCVFENYNALSKRLNGGHILQKMLEISGQKINKTLLPLDRKIYLYSGHENNIVNVLSVLGLYEQHLPPYCSAVLVELHSSLQTNQYGIKVFYENDTFSAGSHLMRVGNCDEFCPFEHFVDLVKDLVPLNYTAECESDVFLN